jgi:hypothetical protein
MFGYFKRAFQVLKEAWLLPRAKTNLNIYASIFKKYRLNKNYSDNNFTKYLNLNKSISLLSPMNNWEYCDSLDEYHHNYKSSFFADGKIRLKNINSKSIIVFLSGYYSNADDVLINNAHPQYLVNDCKRENISIATWSSICQGNRAQKSIYQNLSSIVSLEREYSRFLPLIGTSLWNEYIGEMEYCLKMISSFYNNKVDIITVGWSMGAAFSHISPILHNKCKFSISAGSLARYSDLINEGKTRLHGYFFYPFNNNQFDLEDVVLESIQNGSKITFMYGDKDAGCLASSRLYLKEKFRDQSNFAIKEFENHGHFFSPYIKKEIFKKITEYYN